MAKNKSLHIIDDDVTHSEMLKKYVRDKFSFDIISFSSSEEALRNVHARPDIVILDYNMNRINTNSASGVDVLKQILHNHSMAFIIIIASQDRMEIAREVFKYGVFDYIAKSPSGFLHIENALQNIQKQIGLKKWLRFYQKTFYGLLILFILVVVIYFKFLKEQAPA